jgi:hypothetical protein
MTFTRLSIVSAAVMMTAISPAWAGFQFTAPAQQQMQPVQQAPAALPSAPADMPMPIAPAPEVESVALSPMPGEISSPPKRTTPANGNLVINPYPLQGSGATHGANNAVSLDQAMIEGSGNLRPVVTPGSESGHGRIARAAVTSRFDGNPSHPPRKPANQHFDYNPSAITPLPDGELAPMAQPLEIQAQPLMPRPAPTLPQRSAPPSSAQYTEAIGFGRDLPLALALTQVVPPDYTFSFSPAIDAGTTVSWQGGKPWNVVLDEMLSAHGLSAVISGNQVTIQSAT